MPSSLHHSATMRHGPAVPTTRPPRPSPRTNTGAPRSLNTSTGRGGRSARPTSPPAPAAGRRPRAPTAQRATGRRAERQRAGVAAVVVEAEREIDARAADTRKTEPRERTLDEAAQHEQERLEVVERVLERQRLLHRRGQRLGSERPLVDPARRTHERRARGAEPRGDFGGGQAGEIAEPMDAPALERARD